MISNDYDIAKRFSFSPASELGFAGHFDAIEDIRLYCAIFSARLSDFLLILFVLFDIS